MTHLRTGLHRARGETTTPVERAHAPGNDRLRPMARCAGMRGHSSSTTGTTGQRVRDAIAVLPASRRGDGRPLAPPFSVAMRASDRVRCASAARR